MSRARAWAPPARSPDPGRWVRPARTATADALMTVSANAACNPASLASAAGEFGADASDAGSANCGRRRARRDQLERSRRPAEPRGGNPWGLERGSAVAADVHAGQRDLRQRDGGQVVDRLRDAVGSPDRRPARRAWRCRRQRLDDRRGDAGRRSARSARRCRRRSARRLSDILNGLRDGCGDVVDRLRDGCGDVVNRLHDGCSDVVDRLCDRLGESASGRWSTGAATFGAVDRGRSAISFTVCVTVAATRLVFCVDGRRGGLGGLLDRCGDGAGRGLPTVVVTGFVTGATAARDRCRRLLDRCGHRLGDRGDHVRQKSGRRCGPRVRTEQHDRQHEPGRAREEQPEQSARSVAKMRTDHAERHAFRVERFTSCQVHDSDGVTDGGECDGPPRVSNCAGLYRDLPVPQTTLASFRLHKFSSPPAARSGRRLRDVDRNCDRGATAVPRKRANRSGVVQPAVHGILVHREPPLGPRRAPTGSRGACPAPRRPGDTRPGCRRRCRA